MWLSYTAFNFVILFTAFKRIKEVYNFPRRILNNILSACTLKTVSDFEHRVVLK
jgi:hypothetical protein